ncbi:O-antigen ligase family protein [Oryzihumus leptocrescens]|uniref:O-antigen ligase n=1 Tax=Oryzihumus leptocrescens TaxID=297536 RepID=A0A542ZFG5_9MICO|nr:O-antigen ligase family protein [Oryzihumus leptocrescens]TQL59061.1 O-antigen ligase [Oryzihumus leptocrescens]
MTALVNRQPTAPTRTGRILTLIAAVVMAGAAAFSGMSTAGTDRRLVIVPLAAVLAGVLATLAFTRFAAFVLLILGVRASIDLFKLSGPSSGNTLTNTAAARALDPSTILAVLFLLAASLWLIAQFARDGHLRGSRLRTALVCFSLAGFVGLPGSSQPQASALEALRILSVVMMYVVLEQLITTPEMLRKVLTAAFAGLAFPLLYQTYTIASGHSASEVLGSFTRLTGPFAQANTFARYLAFMLVFGVAILPHVSRRLQLVLLPMLGLSGVYLVLTITRGALIAAVVGIVIVGVVQRSKVILGGVAVAVLAAAVVFPSVSSRFAELGTSATAGGGPTGNTLAWRINYWTEVLPLANKNPVTGIGLNVTQYSTDAAKQPHNDFIRAYVETGLLGLVTYIAALLAMVGNARRAISRSRPGTFERGVAAGALGCAWCFIITSLAANVMSNVVSLWYLITFTAAAAYVARPHNPFPTHDPALPSPARSGADQR